MMKHNKRPKYNKKPIDYFDNRPTKEYLERLIYTEVGEKMVSNVLQITGPALNRHIKNAAKIASKKLCKIYCIEIEPRIFNTMKRRLRKISIDKNKVKLGLGDVTRYEDVFGLSYPCRFEDLDLCQTLQTSKFSIAHRLYLQSRNYSTGYNNFTKCMIFTASLRGCSIINFLHNLNIILDVIGTRISTKRIITSDSNGSNLIVGGAGGHLYTSSNGGVAWKEIKLEHGIQKLSPMLIKRGRLLKNNPKDYALKLYNYRDSSQMMCCTIMYK